MLLFCSEMLVQWTTRDKGSPVVRWGTRSGELSSSSSATTDTYRREDLCGGVANSTGYINPGLFHTAKMSGLAPDTRYFYAYGNEVISHFLAHLIWPKPPGQHSYELILTQLRELWGGQGRAQFYDSIAGQQ